MFQILTVVKLWKAFLPRKGLFCIQDSVSVGRWSTVVFQCGNAGLVWLSFHLVFLRLLACRYACIFTHLSYKSGNKSVGMFTVPLLTWLKSGRIRALTFHNLAKGSHESELLNITKNANSFWSLLWYTQWRLWSHNRNHKSWGMPLECFRLFLFTSSLKRMRELWSTKLRDV